MTTSYTPRPRSSRLSSALNWSIGLLCAHGAIGLIFGALVLASPARATAVFTPFVGYVIAFWLLATGASELAVVLRLHRDLPGWGWDTFFAVATIIAGVILLFVPVGTGFFAAMLVLWCIALSVVFRAVTLLRTSQGWGVGIGIIYVIFAVLMIWLIVSNPAESVTALVWTAGIWGIVCGVTSLVLAWQIQRTRRSIGAAFGVQR